MEGIMPMPSILGGKRAMRKHVVLSLMLLLVLAVAAGAAAAPNVKYHRATADSTAIDAWAPSFTVEHGKDASTFGTDSSTKCRGAGREVTFADLQVGDDVRVSFTEDGTTKTAARVDVAPTKKPRS